MPAGNGSRPRTRARSLPPITVAKLEEVGHLLERVVAANTSLFIRNGQRYREQHHEGANRPLQPVEAAQVASVLGETDPLATAERVQHSDLRAYDEPSTTEMLLAAGAATAPAFLSAVREAVALIEMPADRFQFACENDALAEAIEEDAGELRLLELEEARARASAAFAHFQAAAGFEPGEAWRLPVNAIWQALKDGISEIKTGDGQFSQLIASAASTEGSPNSTSSTGSPGPEPSS